MQHLAHSIGPCQSQLLQPGPRRLIATQQLRDCCRTNASTSKQLETSQSSAAAGSCRHAATTRLSGGATVGLECLRLVSIEQPTNVRWSSCGEARNISLRQLSDSEPSPWQHSLISSSSMWNARFLYTWKSIVFVFPSSERPDFAKKAGAREEPATEGSRRRRVHTSGDCTS